MKDKNNTFQNFIMNINWNGFYCFVKKDPSIREIMSALKRQNEIDLNS